MNIFGRGTNSETTAADEDLDVAFDDDAGLDDTAVDENFAATRNLRGQGGGGNRKTIVLLFVLLLAGGGFAGMMLMGGDDTAVPPQPMAAATPLDAGFQPAPDAPPLDPALAGMPPMPVPAGDLPVDLMAAGATAVDSAAMPPVVMDPSLDPAQVPVQPVFDPALAGMPVAPVDGGMPADAVLSDVAQAVAGDAPHDVANNRPVGEPYMPPVDPALVDAAVADPALPAPAVHDVTADAAFAAPVDMPVDMAEGVQPPAMETPAVAPVLPVAEQVAVQPDVPLPPPAPAAPVAPAVTTPAVPPQAAAAPATGTAEQALADHADLVEAEAALQGASGGYSPEDISRLWSSLPVEDALVRPLPNKYLTVKKEKGAETLDSRLATARRALNEGRSAAALQFFNDLRADFPNDTRVLMGRAVTLQRLGQNAEALQGYEDVLVTDPKHLDALTNMLGLLKQQNPQLAVDKLTDLRSLYPYNADITTQLAVAHAQAGNLNEALRFITLAEALKPDSGYVLYNKAVLYDRLGRTAEAADFYRQVLRRASDGTLDQDLPVESIRKRLSTIR